MKTMEETLTILEREVKSTAAALAKAEAEERSGGRSSVGSPSDLEPMLGVLEDKLIRTNQELEQARRLTYFPSVDGYVLRFSYKDTFLGFKELLLEQLSGVIALSIQPGTGADEQAARVPQVVLRIAGNGGGSEAGALLRFLGEGVSLVTRTGKMLGVSLSPNSAHMMAHHNTEPRPARPPAVPDEVRHPALVTLPGSACHHSLHAADRRVRAICGHHPAHLLTAPQAMAPRGRVQDRLAALS